MLKNKKLQRNLYFKVFIPVLQKYFFFLLIYRKLCTLFLNLLKQCFSFWEKRKTNLIIFGRKDLKLKCIFCLSTLFFLVTFYKYKVINSCKFLVWTDSKVIVTKTKFKCCLSQLTFHLHAVRLRSILKMQV